MDGCGLLGEIDLAHAALAKCATDAIAADARSFAERLSRCVRLNLRIKLGGSGNRWIGAGAHDE